MGLKIKTKTVETIRFKVRTIQRDIDGGRCGLISACMEKVAIERALRKFDPSGGDHRVKIDGGNFVFNLRGHRWRGFVPKAIKKMIIAYDHERPKQNKAQKLGQPFTSKIGPHEYTIEAHKQEKIQPFTRERQEQVNEARRRRVAEGRPDKQKYDLRYRVEGLGNV
jgi:hypothetical protein